MGLCVYIASVILTHVILNYLNYCSYVTISNRRLSEGHKVRTEDNQDTQPSFSTISLNVSFVIITMRK